MKGKYKAILFDMDGVVLDSSDTWWYAINATLVKFGRAPDTKEHFLRKYWGPHLSKSFAKIGLGKDAVLDCNDQYYRFNDKIRLFPDTIPTLSKIKKKGFKTALVTNTPRKITLSTLEKTGIKKYFDEVYTGSDVKTGKPAPDMILAACEKLGVGPKDCVLVGDTWADVEAGKSAGVGLIIGINVEGGNEKVENLEETLKIIFS